MARIADWASSAVTCSKLAGSGGACHRAAPRADPTAGHRQILFDEPTRKYWPIELVWIVSGRHIRPFWGGYRHEVLVKPCRTLGDCHPVNDIAVRPERCGNVANRKRRGHRTSRHRDRGAETRDETTASGKATTESGAGGDNCSSPGSASPSNTAAGARFSTGEACGD